MLTALNARESEVFKKEFDRLSAIVDAEKDARGSCVRVFRAGVNVCVCACVCACMCKRVRVFGVGKGFCLAAFGLTEGAESFARAAAEGEDAASADSKAQPTEQEARNERGHAIMYGISELEKRIAKVRACESRGCARCAANPAHCSKRQILKTSTRE